MEQAFLLQHNFRFWWNPVTGAAISDPGWLRIASGISSIDTENNEEVDQTGYYDLNGGVDSTVIGFQLTYSFEGHRQYEDPAQNFIYNDAMLEIDTMRRGEMLIVAPDKKGLKGPASLVNVNAPGGDANAKGEISFDTHFSGKPEKIDEVTEEPAPPVTP
ncbi:phage tail tube protein [Listeria newyorkensis]|uniref:Capsid protein n=1 Tax=Listeria newyorkensis TaxID=1497681 RepID=A0A841Z2L7_9LIST|nr:capsid protein [Listeria newyorkensis]MBC1459073.1 capsid protein [Listeria newyorkensis]